MNLSELSTCVHLPSSSPLHAQYYKQSAQFPGLLLFHVLASIHIMPSSWYMSLLVSRVFAYRPQGHHPGLIHQWSCHRAKT